MGTLSLEELEQRGIMDERDIDYLEHLETPDLAVTEAALEGIVRAVVHGTGSVITDTFRESKGWFLGIEAKRQYIEEICNDLINWLKDKDVEYRDLNLDMGSFKTWMKTSEAFRWRYYFLLNNGVWSDIESDLKSGNITKLETLVNINFRDREVAANYLDSITNIKNLIKVVELYKKRSNTFFELITKRKIQIKQAPFQVILLGATDLRRACKKIVNLAI